MLRNGSLGQRELIHQVTADTGLFLSQQLQDSHPRRMRKGFGQVSDSVLFVRKYLGFRYTHMAKVSPRIDYRIITINISRYFF